MRLSNDNQATICTTTGTMFTMFVSIKTEDILKTIILGCVGATVSFLMALLLNWLSKIFKKWVWWKINRKVVQ